MSGTELIKIVTEEIQMDNRKIESATDQSILDKERYPHFIDIKLLTDKLTMVQIRDCILEEIGEGRADSLLIKQIENQLDGFKISKDLIHIVTHTQTNFQQVSRMWSYE